jgi:hypothetical protein
MSIILLVLLPFLARDLFWISWAAGNGIAIAEPPCQIAVLAAL